MSTHVSKSSVIGDWLIFFLTSALSTFVVVLKRVDLHFDLDDLSIRNSYKSDSINDSLLSIICIGAVFIVIIGFQLYKKRPKFDFNQAVLGILFSYAFSTLIVSILKTFVGKLRPDFIEQCKPDIAKVEQQFQLYNDTNNPNYGLRTVFDTSVCTADSKIIFNEAQSFPSGHSSKIFAIMTYLALYIAGQIHLLDRKSYLWKYFVVGVPFLFSTYVALSRISDHRHHPTDVVAGSFIGFVVSVLTYFYFYPSLKSRDCDIPYQNRKGETERELNDMRSP